jgi:hypothetical protein
MVDKVFFTAAADSYYTLRYSPCAALHRVLIDLALSARANGWPPG